MIHQRVMYIITTIFLITIIVAMRLIDNLEDKVNRYEAQLQSQNYIINRYCGDEIERQLLDEANEQFRKLKDR